MSCHGLQEEGIGPPLGGITTLLSSKALVNFINDPSGEIESGQERAVSLHLRYKLMMPSYAWMDEAQVNEAKTREAIDTLVAARGEMMRTVSQMALRMRMVLTPQQWERVRRRTGQVLQQRRQRLGAAPAALPAQPAQPAPPKPRRPAQRPPGPVY